MRGAPIAILAASVMALTACHAQEAIKEQETSVGLAQADGQRPALTPLRGETSGRAVQEVLDVKRQYDEAQLKNDSAWFERMFADDYVFVMPDSSVVTKPQTVEELRSRDITWDSAVGEDMGVRVYGDTAVVTGRFLGKGRFKEKDLNEHQRFTSVWVKRDGRWQAISEHATNMPRQ
jgi:ketosteroid isomerase-like protein